MPNGVIRPDRTMQHLNLGQALDTGHITKAECEQYQNFYIGLNMLNTYNNSFTHQLWAGLWIPLGIKPPHKED